MACICRKYMEYTCGTYHTFCKCTPQKSHVNMNVTDLHSYFNQCHIKNFKYVCHTLPSLSRSVTGTAINCAVSISDPANN